MQLMLVRDELTVAKRTSPSSRELALKAGSLPLLKKLASNIMARPFEPKYRRVKLASPSFASTVGTDAAAMQMLRGA
jgi:hypothetical protein